MKVVNLQDYQWQSFNQVESGDQLNTVPWLTGIKPVKIILFFDGSSSLMGKMCITFSWAVLFLYTAELLPTEVRTSGIGSSSFLGRFGGMIAPWIERLGKIYHPYIPAIVFGVNALLAGLLAIMLPETHGRDLPYTIEEAEQLELVSFLPTKRKHRKESSR